MLGFHRDRSGGGRAGKHRIVSHLGQGATADVYLAVADGPSGFHKLVVLKVLKQSLSREPELRDMFLREARLAARLHHPNVVQTNEVLEVEGTPIMVMEYLEGQPLTQVIVRGRQPPHRFTLAMQLRVLADALNGLHAAHELTDFDGAPLGVVHRDVSPHNLFVTVEGHAKVLDFGIAKLARSAVETRTGTGSAGARIGMEGGTEGGAERGTEVGTEVGTIKGKLRYMAPEQLAGRKLDRRADIYAAGVILWEALAGERMWKGCSEQQIRSRVQAGDLPAPEVGWSTVPRGLDQICRRALSLPVADRHATALELADDLEGALSDLGWVVSRRDIGATVARLFDDVRAETREAIERVVAAPAGLGDQRRSGEAPPGPARIRPSRPRPRLRFGLTTAAASILVVLVALGAWKGGAAFGRRAPAIPAPPVARAVAGVAVDSRLVARAEPGDRTPVVPSPRRPMQLPAPFPPYVSPHLPPHLPVLPVLPGRPAPRPVRPAVLAGVPAVLSDAPSAVALVAITAPAGEPVAAAAAAPVAPAAALAPTGSGAASAARDCDQPFFVDVDGIKKFRPECM